MKKRKKPHKGRPGKGGEPNPGRWGKPPHTEKGCTSCRVHLHLTI
nr:MAG TPA_asm: hypothetical protein [Caudoviricetes sp.]